MIHTRLDGLELDKEKWVELLPSVLKKYNNQKHSTADMSPNMATKKDNHIEVWLNIRNKASFNRKYPPLAVGQKVRVYQKPTTFKKGYHSTWSKEIYTIQLIKDGAYLLNDYQKRRMYRRPELLKVDASEGKDG